MTTRAADDGPVGRTRPLHARTVRTHRVLRVVGLTLTAVLAFGTTSVLAAYHDFKSSIEVSDVTDLVVNMPTPVAPAPEDPDDPYRGKALNILVMGTDFRDEENAEIAGSGEGMRSDTTVLVHVSGDRSWIEIVSIPRDSLVTIPECRLSDGTTTYPRQSAMFNHAFEIGSGGVDDLVGAAACTITTVHELTGVPITDHVVVKMTGVIGVVDALDGVRMCLPEPMVGRKVDLDLPAGEQVLDGHQAINFLRARQGTGMGLEMGSDLARIERQQAFLEATLREILSKNVVASSPQLYALVEAVLQSISASPGLADPAALVGLAFSLRGLDPDNIVFTELPVVDAPWDRNRVLWTDGAGEIWERIALDQPPPGHEGTTDPRDDSDDTGVPASGTGTGASDDETGAGGDVTAGDGPGTGSSGEGAVGGDVSGGSGTGGEPEDGDGGETGLRTEDGPLPGVCAD